MFLALALAVAASPAHLPKIAVLDVQDTSGTEKARATMLTQVVVGELPKLGGFEVISADDVRSMLGFDKQKQMLGCKEDSCLAELGGALGVDYLIVAQLGKLGSRYRFDLRLLNAAKSKVAASEGDFIAGNDDALADAVVSMLHKLLADGGLTHPAESIAATSPTPAPAAAAHAPSAPDSPAGRLSDEPRPPPPDSAWVTAGAAVLLAGVAVVMTLRTKSAYQDAHNCYLNVGHPGAQSAAQCASGDTSLKWSGPMADVLWAGAAACAGVSTYLFLRTPDAEGAGGEVGIQGSF